MKIEIAEPGRMTQSGSSLLKLIQNNNMPVLDLLVRESVQNSLDAGDGQKAYVSVEFLTGEFKKELLNEELEGITDALNKRYKESTYKYIAVRDLNTVGLTGKLHYDEVENNQYGNLLKLIYEISKPQETEGAGGSWGLGKTVYFRIGMGLVLYYSRIVNEEGKYESRFAASLVENEMDDNSLIPILPGKAKRGIAWWGEKIDKNKTKPVTDEISINNFLKIFNIHPYQGEETGTTVIIPYVSEKELLNNNQKEYMNSLEQCVIPFWRNNLEEYLNIAIQRWYAPRLNNPEYPYGKFLKAKVNQCTITEDNTEPVFQIVQALYKRAVSVSDNEKKDILNSENVIFKKEDIRLRNVLKTTKAGCLVYAKVTRNILRTGYPDNKPEPCMYLNMPVRNTEKNKPVLFFTRKPGMVISYEDVGNWVDGIDSTEKNEFIFAAFVLNSENSLFHMDEPLSLEEYVRKSEMADHSSWTDFSIQNEHPRIISKIQNQIRNKISKEFTAEENNQDKVNSGLGKMFGDMLLPPENFGNKPGNSIRGVSGSSQHFEKHKSVYFGYNPSKTEYSPQGMSVNLQIRTREKISSTGIIMNIESETGPISAQDWEEKLGLEVPFEFIEAEIKMTDLDNKENQIITVTQNCSEILEKSLSCVLMRTDNGTGYGVKIFLKNKRNLDIDFYIKLRLYRKDLKPLFNIDKSEYNEGDKLWLQ